MQSNHSVIIFVFTILNLFLFVYTDDSNTEVEVNALLVEPKHCARMDVSNNMSYILLDQEEKSQGLSEIQNTNAVIEQFNSVNVHSGCEVTICKLHLMDEGKDRRVRTSCYHYESKNGSEKISLANLSTDDPNPITKQYIVSTGCSCKKPTETCNQSTCGNKVKSKFEGNQCAKLYKETDCSDCRYDAKIINENESFCPSNTFWVQSFVIKKGCRLSLDSLSSSGIYTNIKSYYDNNNNVEMNAVRYPNPSAITCICDDNPYKILVEIAVYTLTALLASAIFFLVIWFWKWKYRILFRIQKKGKSRDLKEVIAKFRKGVSNDGIQPITDENGKSYVSFGYLAASHQPYQKKWEIPREKVKIYDKSQTPLGSGQFGKVYKGKLKLEDKLWKAVAIKMANRNDTLEALLDEIKMLAYIGPHPNICSMYGACTKDVEHRGALLVLELCSEGNLKDYLTKNKKSFLREVPTGNPTPNKGSLGSNDQQIFNGYTTVQFIGSKTDEKKDMKLVPEKFKLMLEWSKQIASGMEFLSQKQVIHIDLAARNILLTDGLTCKIADFGLSKQLHDVKNYVRLDKEYPLPLRWMSLESIKHTKFTAESDIWSYGVILFEIFSFGENPKYTYTYGSSNDNEVDSLVQALSDGQRLKKPWHCPDNIYEKMQQCWDEDPELRPSFESLQDFFQGREYQSDEEEMDSN